MSTEILVVAVLAFLFLNIAASLWTVRTSAYEPPQKRLQLLLIWLLPVLGALLVIIMTTRVLREDRLATKPDRGDHFDPVGHSFGVEGSHGHSHGGADHAP